MNRKNYAMHIFFIIVAVVTLFSQLDAKVIKFSQKPKFSFEINTAYDDNIFLYSTSYIDDFKNQIRSYRFPFETYDDFIVLLNPSLRLPIRLGPLKPTLFLNYKQYLYSVNSEKSYQIFSVTSDHSIIEPLNIELSYLFLPRYLIRYYRNPSGSSTDYIGCTFTEHLITGRLIYKWNIIKIKPFVRYEIDNYKKNFDFYDGKAVRLGIDANIKPHKLVRINIGIERKVYSADGPVPDISYNENNAFAQIVAKVPNFEKLSFYIGTDIGQRIFTTDNPFSIDPYHKDRKDNKYSVSIGTEYQVSRILQFSAEYFLEKRTVSTPYQIDIEEIKDYNSNRLSIGLKFNPIMLIDGD